MRRSAAVRTLMIAGAVCLAAGSFTSLHAQDADDAKRGVARISVLQGDVSVRRGDSGDWVAAAVNAPVLAQDRVTTGPNSRAEVQFDSANMLRVGAGAEVHVAQLEYRRYMIQVARGTTTFRVLRDSDAEVEIDTPTVSVRPRNRGVYRVTVREDGASEITVRSGDVEIFTPRGSQRLAAGQTMEARGTTADPEFQIARSIPADDWDRWNENRDRELERSQAYRYVSRDVYGAEDLDAYGSWEYDAPYGHVWRPRVAVGWAPYRTGRWAWVDWYGWTWVSSDPWGWAPYHYGRWYDSGRGWCWYPGGMGGRHYWSPALVAFFGFGRGGGVGIGIGGGWGNVGWVPLAPHERFSPWWGRSYYGGYRNSGYMDRSVHISNNVNITNVYRNARVANGATAVNAGDFSRGRFNNPVRVESGHLRDASLSRGIMPAAPGDAHLRYSDRQVQNVPSGAGNTRFFSRRQPETASRVSFAEQRQSLERVSRVPAGERASVAGVAANPTGPARSERGQATGDNRGFRSTGSAAPAASGAAAASPARNDSRGWRRVGDAGGASSSAAPSGSGATAATPGGRGERQSTPSAAPSRNDSNGRFGNSGGASPSSAAPSGSGAAAGTPGGRSERQSTPSAAPSRNDSNGWRRFGNSGGASPSSAAPSGSGAAAGTPGGRSERQSTPSAASRSSENRGWSRFGEPSAAPSSGRSSSSAPSANAPSTAPRSNDSRTWRRFGDPGSSAPSSPSRPSASPSRNESQSAPRRMETPQSFSGGSSRYESSRGVERSAPRETQRYSAPQRQESIRINPPVVRERAPQQAQRWSAPSRSSESQSRASAPSRSSESQSRSSAPSRSSAGPSRSGGNSSGRGSGGESRGSRR